MFKRRVDRFCVLIILNYLIINTYLVSDVKGMMKSKKILYGLAIASILNMGQHHNQIRHPIPIPYPIPIPLHQPKDHGCSHPHCDHHYHNHHHHNHHRHHHHHEFKDYYREDSYPMSEGYEFESNDCNGCKNCNNY